MPDAAFRGMLDTSTVILLGRISDPATLPEESVISAITLAELSVGPHVAQSDDERAARQAHLQQAESDFDVLPFDADSARIRCRRFIIARVWPQVCSACLRRLDRRRCHCEQAAAVQLQSRRFRRDRAVGPTHRPAPRPRRDLGARATSHGGIRQLSCLGVALSFPGADIISPGKPL
jgi:hypothetical protein